MEDLNVKTQSPTSAASPIQAGRDFAASSAASLAQAFTHFLNKGAAKINHAMPFTTSRPAAPAPVTREAYAPAPAERPAPVRDDQPAVAARETAPAPRNADERPAQTQDSHGETADTEADRAETRSSDGSDDRPSDTAAAKSSAEASTKAGNAEDAGAAKIAVVQMHSKGLIEKSAESDGRARKTGRSAKTDAADDHAPMAMAEAVLAGLVANVRPGDDRPRSEEGPADSADAAQHETQRTDGIANALARLVRNQARPTQARNGEEDGKTSAKNAETRDGDDKTAKASAADTRGRQAADLAQRVHPGERIAVEVNVTDDAKTLVSRPAATLAATPLADAEGKPVVAQANNGQNASAQANANTLAAAANQAAAAAVTQANAPQASVIAKTAAIAEVGAATPAQGGANAAGQGQSGAQGPAATQTQSAPGTGAANAAQNTQRPAASFRAEILEQISVNIQKAVKDGADKITIQLRPAELGRVDVRIEVGADGRAQVHVTADRADTLELLQRDARDLARALQDAGLRADAGSLQFGLREQAAEQRQNRAKSNGGGRGGDAADAAGIEAAEIIPAWTASTRPGRVDIRA